MLKRKLVAEDLLALQFVSDVQINPDGRRAVCCVKFSKSLGSYRSRLYELSEEREPIELTHGDFMDVSPRWSPDGSKLLFLSNRNKPLPGLYILESGYGEPKQAVELPEGSLTDVQWSPDGSSVAFQFRAKGEDRTSRAEELRKSEDRSTPPVEVTTWPYRLDGDGLFNDDRFEVHVLELATGRHRRVFGGSNFRELSYCWSPDGKRMAVAAQSGKDSFKKPPSKDFFILDLRAGKKSKIETPRGSKSALAWSPNGQWIACIADDRSENPWGPKSEHILLIEVRTGKWRTLLAEEDLFVDSHAIGDARDPAEGKLFWSADGKWISFQLGEEGRQGLARVDLQGKLERLQARFKGEAHIWSASRDGRAFGATVTSGAKPVEAAFVKLAGGGAVTTMTSRFNAEFVRNIELATPQEFSIRSSDGSRIQCWTLRHPSKTRQRAAIEVHGGPMAMYTTGFFFEMQLLAANGFAVFFSNPRGSTGYGEAFARAIMGNWGELDWQDIQALTDYAANQPYVDPKKICILGGSYGGFMVNWAVGHSNRYYRAVTDRCVSNLMSKWGNSDYMFIPDGNWPGSVFADSTTLWNCSPIKYFARVKTPTLIVHSEGDLRCPIEQGEQVYAALKLLGVETKFIRYPASTSHGMSRGGPPDLRVHRLKAIVDWLKK